MKNSKNYTQLCVWCGTMLGDLSVQEFEKFFKDQGYRIKFAEEVVTLPDYEYGKPVEGTGGRHDILFYIHTEDIAKFAIPRLTAGIRWWEDVVSYNNHNNWYSEEVLQKYPTTW